MSFKRLAAFGFLQYENKCYINISMSLCCCIVVYCGQQSEPWADHRVVIRGSGRGIEQWLHYVP